MDYTVFQVYLLWAERSLLKALVHVMVVLLAWEKLFTHEAFFSLL